MASIATADGVLHIDLLAPGIVRVRKTAGPDLPPDGGLLRYGFLADDWCDTTAIITEQDGRLTAESAPVSVSVEEGRLSLLDSAGRVVLREAAPASLGADGGWKLSFELGDDERFFGLGDQTRERLEHRGTRGDLWVRNVASYVPVPFCWNSRGVGLVVNTTYRVSYDLGAGVTDRWGFAAREGALDYYLLFGPEPRALFERYTRLTGRPPLPPRWGLGLFFICRTQADARELMDDAYTLRREGIPCDAIGLEPGWMSRNYDFSVDKAWHPERFPIPPYAQYGGSNFLNALTRMGYKPGLWLCCDYDLSYEEERRLAKLKGEEAVDEGAGFEQDEHGHLPLYADKLTRRDEPWYRHLQHFVKQGVCWFKQDGAVQVNRHPDRLWGNGMLDAEMHNLYPLLYAKQMYQGFREAKGQRPFVFTVAGWAGFQRYAYTWTGDTGGGSGPLGACLNLSLSGHGMSTPDMDPHSLQGIHFGFLLPWTQLNSWNYWRHPWYQGDDLLTCFKTYAKLRYRLLPYLYGCTAEASRTGWPVLRAMALEFPGEPEADGLLHQYMLGPSLLVGAFTSRLWLPAGEWYNVWTGQRLHGPGWVEPDVPADRGGPLLARAGAIVPLGRPLAYVGQKPDDRYNVHVLVGAAGEFELVEDDGLSLDHESGAQRLTRLWHGPSERGWRVGVDAARGDFADAPRLRRWRFRVHGLATPPRSVTCDQPGKVVWSWDEDRSLLRVDAGWHGVEALTVEIVTS